MTISDSYKYADKMEQVKSIISEIYKDIAPEEALLALAEYMKENPDLADIIRFTANF